MKVIIPSDVMLGQPDVLAMLAAYYSRSHISIEQRLAELDGGVKSAEAIRAAMEKVYIGYGHNSVGEGGDITLFIEGVSMLTTVAIQSTSLYSGQESSTRYIDFAMQDEPSYANHYYRGWLDLYKEAVEELTVQYARDYPERTENGNRAAVFDVARGLLPIGVKTQLSWKGSIRTIREHLAKLLHHPHYTVREDATQIQVALVERFPKLFGDSYFARLETEHSWFLGYDDVYNYGANRPEASAWSRVTAPFPKTGLEVAGTTTLPFNLDYGSFRDLQRHRPSHIRIEPVLGFNQTVPRHHVWYLDHLPDSIRERAGMLRTMQQEILLADMIQPEEMTLSLPMMTMVYGTITATLPQYRYLIELRTQRTVHATLRGTAAHMAASLELQFPNLNGYFTVHGGGNDYAKRGKQGIFVDGKEVATK